MSISLGNLKAAEPLAEQLLKVREAISEMNKAPARLCVYRRDVGAGTPSTRRECYISIPNDAARKLLMSEEARLMHELSELGVEA